MNLRAKTVIITGGGGFLGSHLVDVLERQGNRAQELLRGGDISQGINIWVPRSKDFDFTRERDVIALFEQIRPDVVIHLAAVCGGIGINREKPGTFYYKNLMMGALLMEHARVCGVQKFVAIGSICAYPKHATVPFQEADLWSGYPEETNAPYGIAKKAMLVQAQAYRREFGMNAIYLLPVNLYGPRDNFDLSTSHVIPALIRKCVEAKFNGLPAIEVWGTGMATREFLFVEDAARAIALAAERYDGPEPVNIGAGFEIAIKDLVSLIAELTGFEGEVRWNAAYPDGQPRRMLDCTRAKVGFGFIAETSFREGLLRTIHWFERQRSAPTP
jgi:GDP-L-fucose synthase